MFSKAKLTFEAGLSQMEAIQSLLGVNGVPYSYTGKRLVVGRLFPLSKI